VTQSGAEKVLAGTHLLVPVAGTPNTECIGLELAGGKKPPIAATSRSMSAWKRPPPASGLVAIARAARIHAHRFDDFRIVRDNLAGGNHVTTGRQVPVLLVHRSRTCPPRFSESEARKNGITYRLAKIPMAGGLAYPDAFRDAGFMKTLIDTKSDCILGVHGIWRQRGGILAVVQVAMLAGLPYTTLRDAVFTHPTLPERLISAIFSRAADHCITDHMKIIQLPQIVAGLKPGELPGFDGEAPGLVRATCSLRYVAISVNPVDTKIRAGGGPADRMDSCRYWAGMPPAS